MFRDLHAMPSSHFIACIAPYGRGGLGRHFSEWADACRSAGQRVHLISRSPSEGPVDGSISPTGMIERLATRTVFRYSPGWIHCVENGSFDRRVAAMLPRPTDSKEFTGFGGMSLHSLRRARALGYSPLNVIAANSHVRNVKRLHDIALRRWPLESSWLNEHQVHRTLKEYEIADRIIVASTYTRDSFVSEGVAESKLLRFHYQADPRFNASNNRNRDEFRIVSTGSLSVMKGIPLLIDTFGKLDIPFASLTLVGGSGSPGMRRYLKRAMERDSRIHVAPGDPLPHLQRANLFVHTSYEDGLAYAVLEALSCGVPAIVTDDTGAKEYLLGPRDRIIPTGDSEALFAALRDAAATTDPLDVTSGGTPGQSVVT